MPLYIYKCNYCKTETELFRSVKERDCVSICECGRDRERILTPQVSVDIWKPQWFEHIDVNPIYIESKKQLKEECEKRGVVSIGYM